MPEPPDPDRAADDRAGDAADATEGRVLVVGAGAPATGLADLLGRAGRPTDRVPEPGAVAHSLGRAPVLVVEATPDDGEAAKRIAVQTVLGTVPRGVPVAIATRRHVLAALLPTMSDGSRVVGLNLVAAGGVVRGEPGGRPALVEVALPAAFDDTLADGVLTLLQGRGVVALPTGDTPGRIVDRLVVAVWQEVLAARAGGVAQEDVEGALAEVGITLEVVAREDVAAITRAIHGGLGEPDRFAPGVAAPGDRVGPPRTVGEVRDRFALTAIAEAYRMVEEAVTGAAEIERAMTAGAGWAAGPFTLAARRGLRDVVTALARIGRDATDDAAARDRFAMPRLLWAMAIA